MDPNGVLQDILLFIVLPIMGIAAAWAAIAGKIKVVGVLVVGMCVAAAFVFVPAGTVRQIGTAVAAGVLAVINGTLG